MLGAGVTFIAFMAVTALPAAAADQTAQGNGTIADWAHCPVGSTATFDFSASSGPSGESASGAFSFTCSPTVSWPETTYSGTVGCLAVNGPEATLGGTITASNTTSFPVGTELSFNVIDSGPGGTTDGIGVLYQGATCDYRPGYYTISSGDIVVGDGTVLPTVSIGDRKRLESTAKGQLSFTLTLSGPSATPVTVGYTTVDGTATAPSDYEAKSGTVTFAPGALTARVRVRIVNDAVAEPDETFTVVLSTPVGATIADGTAVGTIRNDDGTP